MIFTPIRDTSYRRAALLICSLALMALAAVACEIEADLPPRVAVAATAIPSPAETPSPEPMATPEITITPAPEPTPVATVAPEPAATPAPEQTSTPEITITPAPESQPGQAAGLSRENPVTPGRYAESADGLFAFAIVSTDMDADFSALMAEIPYYDPDDPDHRLEDGNRLVAARALVQNVGGDGDNALFVNEWSSFSVIGSSETEFFERGCRATSKDAALFLGEIAEISVCFEVPESETDLVLIHASLLDLLYAKPSGNYAPQLEEPRTWLALGNPDSVEPARVVDAPIKPQPGQAAGRSRFNPVPPGEYVESADGLLAFAVVSTDMDADISAIPYSRYHSLGDPYYRPPAEGNRLIAARVRVQNIGGDVDTALTVGDEWEFAIVGSSGIESYHYNRGCRATLDPPELFLGGIAEINICFEAPESETDLVLNHASGEEWEERMGYYYSPDSREDPRRWLAFGNPDTVEAAPATAASPETSPDGQANGRLRSAAAPFGASAYNRFGMAVSIVSADLDATDEILRYNPSNGPPGEGNRFIMARARLDWVGGDASDNVNIGGYSFGMAGSSAVVFSYYDNSCGAISDAMPILELSGGETGEIDICFEVPQSETDLILFYGSLRDDSARWLRLPEG